MKRPVTMMAAAASSSPLIVLSFLSLIFLNIPHLSTANIHKSKILRRQQQQNFISQHTHDNSTNKDGTTTAPPTIYFEVTKPIQLPKIKPCSHLILQHTFASTYGKPPVLSNYTPPLHCNSERDFSRIVLQWSAYSKGRQFDRIFGIWLGGVELLRSCTAEPRATGTFWTVQKDVTRYHSLLMKPNTLAVSLGNIVDDTYTGVYHVNVTIHFYPDEENSNGVGKDRFFSDSKADLIMPISRKLPLIGGQWFEIYNYTESALKKFTLPSNVYRAVLEVYVSFHENDEAWYGNLPNEYISANNFSGIAGNGPFREVVISLDGVEVGAVWPFTVVYTGGVNPLLWRPITGIGSFDLPTYDIEITPFLGKLLDGRAHELKFRITNGLNLWYVNANLHLWLDHNSKYTKANLIKYLNKPLSISTNSNFRGFDGNFETGASRSISSSGWVKSSFGKIVTRSMQSLGYTNKMVMGKDGNLQIVNQLIHYNASVHVKTRTSAHQLVQSHKTFLLELYSDYSDQGNGTTLSISNITLGIIENSIESVGSGSSSRLLKNVQKGQGSMFVKNNLVVSGLGSTQQDYKYESGESCYFRDISSSNYTVLHDKIRYTCDS